MLENDANPKTLSRLELLKLAQTLRVSDADVMTRAELRAAIERAKRPDPRPPAQPVTWLGVARRLIASIVEQGLHLPDAAALIRGEGSLRPFPSGPPPVATVTLARIYAAQGHLERAIGTLDEVLESDPDHDLARELRAQLAASLDERRARERQERAAAQAADVAARGETRAADPVERELDEPAAAESISASELLGAVPAPGAAAEKSPDEEVTLAGTGAPEPPPVPEPIQLAKLPGGDAASVPAPSVSIEPPAQSVAVEPPAQSVAVEPPAQSAAVEPPAQSAAVEPPARSEPLATTPADGGGPGSGEPGIPEPKAAPEAAGPRTTGLVLIETGEPGSYVYWELGTSASQPNGNGAEPYWISVVTHVPCSAGSERRERRFLVQRNAGAVRIEGLPAHAVVRAKLTRGDVADAPPLVVAGAVWALGLAGLERSETRYSPFAAADPRSLAARAGEHLASAAPIYY